MPSSSFHTQVKLKGFHFEDSGFTMNLDANVTANHVGAAMALDTSGPNKAKLAGNNDPIIGQLVSFENRVTEGKLVGTVEMRFASEFTVANGQTVAVGDVAVGAGNGQIKAITLANAVAFPNRVYEVTGNTAVVVKI